MVKERREPRKAPTFCYRPIDILRHPQPLQPEGLALTGRPKGRTYSPPAEREAKRAGGRERRAKSLQLTGWTAGREARAVFREIKRAKDPRREPYKT